MRDGEGRIAPGASSERGHTEVLGYSKTDLAQFYADIAHWMLPYIANRPLTLVRCERPIRTATALRTACRFLPHDAPWNAWASASVRRVHIQELKKVGEYLVVDSPEGLVSLVQGDILEIHAWNSTVDRIEHPDRIVLDLDPGEGVVWSQVVAAAQQIRALLTDLGLRSWTQVHRRQRRARSAPLRPRAWLGRNLCPLISPR